MFWNLIVQKYEKYHISHIIMLVVLGLYTVLGAICFCAFEAQNEREHRQHALETSRKKSALARDRLLYDLQFFFIKQINVSRLLGREFHKTLDYYDRLMGFNTETERYLHWDIWGGLYFAGTIYTTIGYSDIVTKTISGKIFTVFYAIVGIPLLITVLNIWGNGLFQLTQFIWRNYINNIYRKVKFPHIKKSRYGEYGKDENESDEEFIIDNPAALEASNMAVDIDNKTDSSKLPLYFAFAILIGWIFVCAALFCFLEKWTLFDAAYFFFISFTTIGFGNSTVNHKTMCMYFLLILIGLAMVSMSINVIQLNIELLFTRIVTLIDNDFKNFLVDEKRKHSTATSIGDERKISANIAINVPRSSLIGALSTTSTFTNSQDAINKYRQQLNFTDRILSRMMSKHQCHMLNQKLDERQKMKNVAVQTQTGKSSAFAQTEQDIAIAASTTLGITQSAYTSSEDDESEESGTPASCTKNSFAAMMAAAAAAGRRSASAGPTAGQRVNASKPSVDAAMRGATAAPGNINNANLPIRHHRQRGLTRKKLYIYNIGD